MKKSDNPIILKKKRRFEDEEGGSHGTWKIAYADFVTAMMCFFLLMWLVNITSKEQKEGISNYFSPISLSRSTAGGDGLFDGGSTPVKSVTVLPGGPERSPATGQLTQAEGSGASPEALAEFRRNRGLYRDLTPQEISQAIRQHEAEVLKKAMEDATFRDIEKSIRASVNATRELKILTNNLIFEITPEGLRIQITDRETYSMFDLGSANLKGEARTLIRSIADLTRNVPNKISISGHTDGLGYATQRSYSNWELSSDRANAARRELLEAGISPDRIARVEGLADTDHLIKSNPNDPRNRRIAITLQR